MLVITIIDLQAKMATTCENGVHYSCTLKFTQNLISWVLAWLPQQCSICTKISFYLFGLESYISEHNFFQIFNFKRRNRRLSWNTLLHVLPLIIVSHWHVLTKINENKRKSLMVNYVTGAPINIKIRACMI